MSTVRTGRELRWGDRWRDRIIRLIARNDAYISPGNSVHEPLIGRRMFNQAQRELDKRTRG